MTAVTGSARTATEVLSPLVGGGLIGLRVALGAAIMVALLVAVLVKSGHRAGLRRFWLGATAAIVMAVGVYLLVRSGAANVTAVGTGGVASLIAVAFLTAVVLGARTATVSCPAGPLAALAAFALGCATAATPAIPAAVFIAGYADTGARWPVTGVGSGVLVAAAIGYTAYAVAVRIAPRRFFPIVEVALIATAAGLLSRGVGTLQQVGWLPGYHSWAFDTGWWSGWWSVPGSVARQVFYVAPTPTVAQFAAWLAYLVVMLAVSPRSPGLPEAPPST